MTMKVEARLTAKFGAVLVLLLAICVMISVQMSRMNADTQSIVNEHVGKATLGHQLVEGTYLAALEQYAAVSERTPEAQRAWIDQAGAQERNNAAISTETAGRLVAERERALFDQVQQAQESFAAALKPVHVQ
jgi:methyl-accepting chemotaxis protein